MAQTSGKGQNNQGLIKLMANISSKDRNLPIVTVITVVLNDELTLERTIRSVISQCYPNMEYLVLDGGSSDNTLEVIRKYDHAIDYWESKKDNGLYSAMNNGIALAKGEWINFMNSGDTFYDVSSLKQVFENRRLDSVDVIYCDHQVIYPSGRTRLASAGSVQNIWKGSQFCHQACFVRTNYHRSHKFNESTKIVADFEFFYKAWKENARFLYVNLYVAKYRAGGLSDRHRIKSVLAWWSIVDKSIEAHLRYLFLILFEAFKAGAKKILPLSRRYSDW